MSGDLGLVATADDSRALYLAPSAIRCLEAKDSRRISAERQQTSVEPTPAYVEGQHEIRLEAVEVDGRWFALDSERLEFYKRLEQEGVCRRVRVEPVSITQLSKEMQTRISETVTSIKNGAIPDTPVIQGYQILDEGKVDNKMSESLSDLDHHSDSSSNDDNSSSECDWSEDEGDSSDDGSDEEVGQKQRTLADGKSDSSNEENEQLIGEES